MENKTENRHLIVSNSIELLRFAAEHILYIEGEGNYSSIHLVGGSTKQVVVQLGTLSEMISEQMPQVGKIFCRVGKSCIINFSYIYSINPQKKMLVLRDKQLNDYSISASVDALKKLKGDIEYMYELKNK